MYLNKNNVFYQCRYPEINIKKLKNSKAAGATVFFFIFCFIVIGCNPVSAQTTKVIYFMAGVKDHAGPSRHETEKDLLVLQRCLDSVSNISGVKIVTRFIYKRTDLDINDMKDAAAIVIESSAEGSNATNRVHPLFPPSGNNKKSYEKEVAA